MMAEYFLTNEPIIVGVVMISVAVELRIFWKIPESWSAWTCVRMILSIIDGGMPIFIRASVLNVGGSTRIPFWLIQIMNPEVLSFGSKPLLLPKKVIPKSGGSKVILAE